MSEETSFPPIRNVAVIGNYLPRQCGIATFTTDLCESLAGAFPDTRVFALPVNDTPNGYAYPPRVRFELVENDLVSYRRAADFLNVNNVDLVCLQHEYGIFGGPSGSHILALLRELRIPIVTTLHTILRSPDVSQRKVMEELAHLSDRLVVMSNLAAEFLQELYAVPEQKIVTIPHGIPDIPFIDPNFYKDQFGVAGKTVLLTFGLLSANKGLEHVITALPQILKKYPDVVYIVLGATHPHVKRHEGETYRLMLQRLAKEQGVEQHVIFYDQFVSLEELVEFIGATDIYITPYLNPAQIASGTLAYSVGAGKAVVSTNYWYAEELLADGRGILVPFQDAAAIARQVTYLLDNEPERHAIRKRAFMMGREMIWPQVARRYMETFQEVRAERNLNPRPVTAAVKSLDERPRTLPLLRLNHLQRLTDDTGIIEHAIFSVPNHSEGYSSDDNARALVATVLLEELGTESADEVDRLATRYLAFLAHAFNPAHNRFRNDMTYDRQWPEEVGSEDSHGRVIWALGTVLGLSNNQGLLGAASHLFEMALPAALEAGHPRPWAFTLLGIHEYLRRFSGDRAARHAREVLAERLMELYSANCAEDWPWCEDLLTYDNAKLPHALIISGRWMDRSDMIEAGLKALDWLAELQRARDGHFVPIGCNGFFQRGGEPARFDQQPIEAHAMVSACLEAYRITGNQHWHNEAQRAFDWFLGHNDLQLPLYDPSTGGCRDGLQPDRVNGNQGAESTLAFLLSLLEMRLAELVINPATRQ